MVYESGWRFAAVFLVIAGLAAGFFTFTYLAKQTPRTGLELPDGRQMEVTPVDAMRVRTAETAPAIDPESYRLRVIGLVDRPLELSFAELQQLPAAEELVDLPCVEGWTETGLRRGPRLYSILEMAGMQPDADNVVLSSLGGYTTSLTPAEINGTDPILAYGANGVSLPDRLGFPLRLVVPHHLGYKWIKWVIGIEVIQGDYRGYWESRGYPNQAQTDR
jgi:DMSO/TMAO reductase YedYZ molybdopterin-dependent catalytic subunit